MTHGQDASVVTQERADDEKTIQVERSTSYSEKKDLERAQPESISDSVKPHESVQEQAFVEDDYPDGGLRAWIIVLGVSELTFVTVAHAHKLHQASLGTFATFGFVNAWGVFQAYYEQGLLSTTSPSTMSVFITL